MCASYRIQTKKHRLQALGIPIPQGFHDDELDILVQGYKKTEKAPVVVLENGRRSLKEMYFSLCPRWSGEFPFKAASYNARMNRPKIDKRTDKRTRQPLTDPGTGSLRIEYIFEMPTWKASFRDRHCLAPMSWAIESSYFGTHAGNMVRFLRQDEALFLAVGIWDRWIHPDTGESVESFALLTDDPCEFFYRTGHDRSFLVLPASQWDTWLRGEFPSPKATYEFLRRNRIDFDWKTEIERPMKAGWEKRAPNREEIRMIGETVWKEPTRDTFSPTSIS
uniref:SOS response associated peptidase (SRAP) n=1 Tax=Candidatus Kentrum sp. MB TaxID=2138164 RepID=A0A450XXQ5_9GAMM|nr:MAG: SOS response associated peptidase (SRAP) [Candidatus Kentron sp. MB]VFK76579.1 MAG: SOS response associated peptidase (SRAP) [Candidatus Kentron sp. MB]